jgi:hypothetical protein
MDAITVVQEGRDAPFAVENKMPSTLVRIMPAVTAMLLGCTHTGTQPVAPPPSPQVATSAPSDRGPPPKCESLEETCIATADTRASIGQSGWSIVPPSGWRFAHASTTTFASMPDAVMAITTFDRLDKSRSRETILRELTEKLGVSIPARKELLPKKPHKRQAVGSITLSLYQFDRVRRSQQNGVMVVFTSDLPSSAAVLGLAFVAASDRRQEDRAVVRAIESLSPPEAAAPRPERTPTAKLHNSESEPDTPAKRKENYGLDLHTLQ